MSVTFHITTLGCPKNTVDSENMAALLEQAGHFHEPDPASAQVLIVNTCCFIGPAKEESIETILEAARLKESTGGFLVVTGCMPQRYKDQLADEMPEVDSWMGLEDLSLIRDVVEQTASGKSCRVYKNPSPQKFQDLPRTPSTPIPWAYLKIAEGCSHSCNFCIIPKLRGKYRSLSIESAVEQAKSLTARGTGEIIMVAQDTTLYGVDLYGKPRLSELLQELSRVEDIQWLRLMYAYPSSLSNDVLKTMASLENVCNYVDIPLQHSHRDVLKKMGRPHREDPARLVERIRKNLPGAVLRTAFIVGHPGETEKRFLHLVDFIRENRFYHCGVFAYSPEEDTASALFKTRSSNAEARRRAQYLMEVQQEISLQLRQELIGKTIKAVCEEVLEGEAKNREVLIDLQSGELSGVTDLPPGTRAIGRTINDAPEIDGLLFIKGEPPPPGSFFNARITGCGPYDTIGEAQDVQTP